MYRLLLNRGDLQINESKANEYESDPLTCQGYGDPCQELVTQAGQHYIVTHGEYQNKAFDLRVSWVKGDTNFVLSVDDSVLQTYLTYDWRATIDSFKPVDITLMEVHTETGHCCGG